MAVCEVPSRTEARAMTRVPQSLRPSMLLATMLMLVMLATVGIAGPAVARDHPRFEGSDAQRVIEAARSHLGAKYRWSSTGPNTFDCSGLVYRVFKQAHIVKRIGGFNTAHGYYAKFRHRGWTSRSNGRPGDIVVYNKGGHVGVYLGNGKVISALLSGVKVHSLRGLNIRFTTFIHLDLRQGGNGSTVAAGKKRAPTVWLRTERKAPLRAKPGQGARLVKKLAKDRTMKVLTTHHHGAWSKVRLHGGRTGWIRTSLTERI